jgi:hypothetical protein
MSTIDDDIKSLREAAAFWHGDAEANTSTPYEEITVRANHDELIRALDALTEAREVIDAVKKYQEVGIQWGKVWSKAEAWLAKCGK